MDQKIADPPKTADERDLAQNVDVSVQLLIELGEELRATVDKLERSRAAIEAQLDILKTTDLLIRKIQRFDEAYVAPKRR